MSYILEALKKSKEERQGEDAPHLHIVHGVPLLKPRFRLLDKPGIVAGSFAILLLVGVFFIFLLTEDKPEESVKASKSINVRQIEIRSQFIEQPEESTVVVQDLMSGGGLSVLQDDRSQIIRISRSNIKKVLLESTADDVYQAEEQFWGVKYRKDLPVDIQKELPDFKFAGHTYADDPKRRMIIINNTILREGDAIDVNTKLLNIIWEGIVLEYKGIVFKQRTH